MGATVEIEVALGVANNASLEHEGTHPKHRVNKGDKMINVRNLTQDFLLPGGSILRVLHDINLTLPSSQTIAIVGQSGSGKTTLLSLLAGLERPTQGTIEVFGTHLDNRIYIRCPVRVCVCRTGAQAPILFLHFW